MGEGRTAGRVKVDNSLVRLRGVLEVTNIGMSALRLQLVCLYNSSGRALMVVAWTCELVCFERTINAGTKTHGAK